MERVIRLEDLRRWESELVPEYFLIVFESECKGVIDRIRELSRSEDFMEVLRGEITAGRGRLVLGYIVLYRSFITEWEDFVKLLGKIVSIIKECGGKFWILFADHRLGERW